MCFYTGGAGGAGGGFCVFDLLCLSFTYCGSLPLWCLEWSAGVICGGTGGIRGYEIKVHRATFFLVLGVGMVWLWLWLWTWVTAIAIAIGHGIKQGDWEGGKGKG